MNENCSFSSGDKVGFLLLCDAFQDMKRELLAKEREFTGVCWLLREKYKRQIDSRFGGRKGECY